MPVMQVRGVGIRYEVLGDAGPWVALMPGGRRGYDEFVSLGKMIAAGGCRVLLHDRRNTGASDIVIDGADGEEEIWTDDLQAMLGQLGVRRAVIGGSSSGARTSVLAYLRHPELVQGLFLMRVTAGAFAAGRLPEMYYGQFIRAARSGGMAAVCETEQYRERLAANPANRARLMAMKPERYVEVMTHWLSIFNREQGSAMMGVKESDLRAIRVPTVVIPGNDKTHSMANGRAVQKLIPGSRLVELPLEDLDVPLLPFADWAPHEPQIAAACIDLVRSVND